VHKKGDWQHVRRVRQERCRQESYQSLRYPDANCAPITKPTSTANTGGVPGIERLEFLDQSLEYEVGIRPGDELIPASP
jgi:hypothetical protein